MRCSSIAQKSPRATSFSCIDDGCRWPPHAVGTHPGVLANARRLALQGVQLGLVGLLTGCAGSAAAHQLERHRQRKGRGGGRGSTSGAVVATPAAVGDSREVQPDMQPSGAATMEADAEQRAVAQPWQRQTAQQRLKNADALQAAAQRMVFMAISANLRHAILYAAEDSLGLYATGLVRLWAARLLLHGANALLAAAQWQRMSQGLYAT